MTTTIETFEGDLNVPKRTPRSRTAIASGITVLAALPLAIVTALTLGGGDGVVVHTLLGLGVMLLLVAVDDFHVPRAITWIGRVGIVTLGTIFLLQALADAVPWPLFVTMAYEILGQFVEKFAMYPILLWFAGLLIWDSAGKTRVVGVVVMSIVFAVELYSIWLGLNGQVPDALFRAAYLLPFVWLVAESTKPR